MPLPIDAEAQAVLDFWFGADGDAAQGVARKEWFIKDDAFDRRIGDRFGATIERALRGELDAWDEAPRAALARIVVLDQFTRNAFRGTPRAFAGDAQALAAAKVLVAAGCDEALPAFMRAFAYLPFEHAESLPMQDESVRLFTRLAGADAQFASMLDFAHRHRAVIARFGRFPHRNAILGRRSTAEEMAFLKEPGSSF
jgi:uncharacterized protein (DUF924 family)